jgi:hypothetical protein
MTHDNVLANIKVAAGKRTYYIDVHKAQNDTNYLKICELKLKSDGDCVRHGIMIFEEDIPKVVKALRVALPHFKKPVQAVDAKSRMKHTKESFANAYKAWTDTDDLTLVQLYTHGTTLHHISGVLQRNVGAIRSRIEKLHLKNNFGKA